MTSEDALAKLSVGIAISLPRPQPTGLDWDTIHPEQYQQILILQQLKAGIIS